MIASNLHHYKKTFQDADYLVKRLDKVIWRFHLFAWKYRSGAIINWCDRVQGHAQFGDIKDEVDVVFDRRSAVIRSTGQFSRNVGNSPPAAISLLQATSALECLCAIAR